MSEVHYLFKTTIHGKDVYQISQMNNYCIFKFSDVSNRTRTKYSDVDISLASGTLEEMEAIKKVLEYD